MDDEQKHLGMAGHLLVLMVWVQNVMSNLIILKQNPEMLRDFQEKKTNTDYGEKRIEYWQKSFGQVKRAFVQTFPEIVETYGNDLNQLQHLRDFFAHARYSLKSEIIFYQPSKSRRDLQEKVEILTKHPFDEDQTFMKVKMNGEKYHEIFQELMKFENEIFPKVAEQLDIDLNRLK